MKGYLYELDPATREATLLGVPRPAAMHWLGAVGAGELAPAPACTSRKAPWGCGCWGAGLQGLVGGGKTRVM